MYERVWFLWAGFFSPLALARQTGDLRCGAKLLVRARQLAIVLSTVFLLGFSCFSSSPLQADELEQQLSGLRTTNQTIQFDSLKRAVYLPCTLLLYFAATFNSDTINHGALMTTGAFVISHEIWLRQNSEARQRRTIQRRFQSGVVRSLFEFEAQWIQDIESLFQSLSIPYEEGATLAELAERMKAFNLKWVGIEAAPKIFDDLDPAEKKELWENVLSLKNRCETWREAESLTRRLAKLRGNLDAASMKLLAKELDKLSHALWSPSHFRN